MTNQVAIGVGSNINAEENIEKAKDIIQKEHLFVKASSYLQTKPVGFKDQPDFINCAFLVKTEYDFDAFAEYLHSVEDRLGRIRTENKYGPRSMDLDIVVWNEKIVDPDFHQRAFLRQSILQILPNLKT